MQPIYFTLNHNLSLTIIPDTQAHLDGHTIITHTYHIHRTDNSLEKQLQGNLEMLGLNHSEQPDYMGYLTFDVPGRVYTYTSDGAVSLSAEEIEQVIEYLNHVRENPSLWPQQHY